MRPSSRAMAADFALPFLGLLLVTLLGGSGSLEAQFTFVKVVGIGDPGPTGEPFVALAFPRLNDAGQTAFLGYVGPFFPGRKGLFLVTGGEIKKVALEGEDAPGGGAFTFDYVNFDLNNAGHVVFVTGVGGGAHAIFLATSLGTTEVLRTGDGSGGTFASLDNPAINNHEEIAFTGSHGGDQGGIFRSFDGIVTKVWVKGDPAPGGSKFESTLSPPSISDGGRVAAAAEVVGDFVLKDGSSCSCKLSGIFLSEGEGFPPSTIALAGVDVDGGAFAPPDVNIPGDVVFGFESSFSGPRWRLYRNGPEGSLQKVVKIAQTGDPAPGGGTFGLLGVGLLRPDRMNDHGQVVFDATLSGNPGAAGIFLANGPSLVRVVAVGDPAPRGGVFGELGSPTINNAGCIAFVGTTQGAQNSGAIYGCDPAVGFNDLSLSLEDAIQPVQVSWQKDPGSEPDYPATDDMQKTGERSWSAGLPMVKGKSTRFFGYLRNIWQGFDAIRMTIENHSATPRGVRVELEIRGPSGALQATLALGGAVEVPAARSLDMPGFMDVKVKGPVPAWPALAFQFPEAGAWQLRVVLKSSDGSDLSDVNPDNNQITVAVEVRATPKLRVLYKPLIFEDDEKSYPAGFFKDLPRNSLWSSHHDFLQATFPLAEGDYEPTYVPVPLKVTFTSGSVPGFRTTVKTLAAWRTDFSKTERLIALATFSGDVPALVRIKGSHDRIVVLVPQLITLGQPGMLSVDGAGGVHYTSQKQVVFVEWYEWMGTVCHELGHSFGLHVRAQGGEEQYKISQVNPGLGFSSYGSWVRYGVDYARFEWPNDISFMGVVGLATWIDKPGYRKLLEKFSVPELDPEVILVRGVLLAGGSFEARPWYRFQGALDVLPGTPGTHTIALLDQAGSRFLSMGFTPDFHVHADFVGIEALDVTSFAFTVPYVPGVARVQILGPDGGVLDDRPVSPHAPRVAITSPRTGDVLSAGTHTVAWEGSDEDGGNLVYTLYVSSEGQDDWWPLAADVQGTEYLWSFIGELPPGMYRLAVVATDGVNTGEAEVGPFTVAVIAATGFIRADSNADGKVDISDPVATLGWLFLGGTQPVCLDAADANDDGTVDISDAVFTLGYLFSGSEAPPEPGPDACGGDPTPDDLGACAYPGAMCP